MKQFEKFDFENLRVWQKAISFAQQVLDISENLNTDRKHFRLVEQLESACTSVAMNIAEGKGRFSKKEYVQFLYYARGSLNEVITLLIIFSQRSWIKNEQLTKIKSSSIELAKMLNALIRSIKIQS